MRRSIDATLVLYSLRFSISSGTYMLRSCFALTWQVSLKFCSFSSSLRLGSSVGRKSPTPVVILALHSPHDPLPPHADGMNTCSSFSVARSGRPPRTVSSRSSFIVIVTSP